MNTLKLFSIFSFLFLACSPATKEENSALEEERNSLREQISVLKGETSSLENQKATLAESITTKEKELSIYQEGRVPVYIVKFEISLRKNLDLATYNAEFELPVPKEYFDAVQIGQDASDVSAYKSFSISFVSSDCTVKGKRIQ